MDEKIRCGWCLKDELYMAYHDQEWGVPLHDDRKLFEMLVLEGAQAGLSWHTVLKKRNCYREAFDQFDAETIAAYDEEKIQQLLHNEGIIRNRLKIRAAVQNARAYLKVREEFGSFDHYIWQFTDYQTIVSQPALLKDVPVTSEISDSMSRDLLKRGFKFVGSTICYAYMQAIGMVDDHLIDCWRKQN